MYSNELFSILSQVKFVPCELDPNKIEKYLNQVNSSYKIKPYVELVLSKSQRIPTDMLCRHLRSMALEYLSDPSSLIPQYVFLPKKIGSEQYFFSQVYDLFPEIFIPENIIRHETKLNHLNEINVLIVDDASFSGNNTLAKIDDLTYNNKKTKFNFIILIPYQLEPFDIVVQNQIFPIDQASRINIINVSGYIKPPTIELDNYFLENESNVISTCYFDHKVPNNFGSWPQIYLEGYLFDKNKTNFGNLFFNDQIPTKQPILNVFDKFD
jgi:hypothetical protein